MKEIIASIAGAFTLLSSFLYVGLSNSDDPFYIKASHTNLAEIQFGKLASAKGSDKIKSFGRKMEADYSRAENELATLAKKQQVNIARHLDVTHKEILDSLKNLTGKEFDGAYIKNQLDDQQTAIDLFREESVNGIDSDARMYAGKYLPLLKMNLEMFKGELSGMHMSVDSSHAKK
jgi:putative membrane protein